MFLELQAMREISKRKIHIFTFLGADEHVASGLVGLSQIDDTTDTVKVLVLSETENTTCREQLAWHGLMQQWPWCASSSRHR